MISRVQGNDSIAVENLPRGIYIVEILTEKEKIYKKILKE
ncbi:T9SS type A sorting domain-containing protein [Flavobacterium cyanobacteriorum]